MKAKLEGKVVIKAVYDSELQSFLEKLGLWEDMKNGHLRCSVCDCVLTFDNFGGIYKKNGQLKSFCQKAACYLEVLKRKNAVR
jgi:hypothetical protein